MNKTSCCIFGAGDVPDVINIPDNAYIIAADGGLGYLNKLGVNPDIILGDFDSYKEEISSSNFIKYPKEKDFTDMFIAVQYAHRRGFTNIFIYGGLGGNRFDHSVANLQLLEHFAKKGCNINLYGKNEIVTAISGVPSSPASISFDASHKGFISLFASGDKVTGLTIKGLKYELENSALSTDFPLGVSNEFCNKSAEITIKTGTLILIYSYE